METTIESGLKTVFLEAKAYGADEHQVRQTVFHLARKGLSAVPDATYRDFDPLLEPFCTRHQLDLDTHKHELYLLIADGTSLAAPFIEAKEMLEANPWRVDLPEAIPQTDDLKTLATAAYYLDKNTTRDTWHLSCRKAGELIGKSHTHANTCLRILQSAGVIQLTIEAHWESETNEATGEQKRVHYAAEFRYTMNEETANFTQVTQATQTTHHHQEVPALSDFIEEVNPTVPMQEHGGGGDASLFEEQPRKANPLGTADELIEMSVTEKPGGVLGVLPRQVDMPMPEPVRVREPERKAAVIDVHQGQTATAPRTERTKPQDQWDGLSETAKRNSPVCDHCGKRAFEHTPEEAESHYQLARKQTAPKSHTPADTLRRESAKLNKACKAEGVAGYERTKRFAGLFAKTFGDTKASTVKYAVDLIDQYSLREFGQTASSVLAENATRRTPFDNPIGVVGYRLRTNANTVAV